MAQQPGQPDRPERGATGPGELGPHPLPGRLAAHQHLSLCDPDGARDRAQSHGSPQTGAVATFRGVTLSSIWFCGWPHSLRSLLAGQQMVSNQIQATLAPNPNQWSAQRQKRCLGCAGQDGAVVPDPEWRRWLLRLGHALPQHGAQAGGPVRRVCWRACRGRRRGSRALSGGPGLLSRRPGAGPTAWRRCGNQVLGFRVLRTATALCMPHGDRNSMCPCMCLLTNNTKE